MLRAQITESPPMAFESPTADSRIMVMKFQSEPLYDDALAW